MTWAPDGRATFEYGPECRPGELHMIWRWVGKHEPPVGSPAVASTSAAVAPWASLSTTRRRPAVGGWPAGPPVAVAPTVCSSPVVLAPSNADRYCWASDARARPCGSRGRGPLAYWRAGGLTSEAAVALLVGASVFGDFISLGSGVIQLAAACVGLASAVLLRRQVRASRRMNDEDEIVADSHSDGSRSRSH
jgi:hypothetical protein